LSRPSGRAGSAIFLSTAYRSVAGGLPAPAQVIVSVDALEIVIIATADQLYLINANPVMTLVEDDGAPSWRWRQMTGFGG
jgi:hypothetical protein